MKTLEINQLETINGGQSNDDCKLEAGFSFFFAGILCGPLCGLAAAYYTLHKSPNCN